MILTRLLYFSLSKTLQNQIQIFGRTLELNRVMLISNPRKNLTTDEVTIKIKLSKKDLKSFNKKIHEYNKTEWQSRNIYSYSRPVFDNSKKFAIIEWDDGVRGRHYSLPYY